MLDPNLYFPFFASGVGAWIAGGLALVVLILACVAVWRMIRDASSGDVAVIEIEDEDCASDSVHEVIGSVPDEEEESHDD